MYKIKSSILVFFIILALAMMVSAHKDAAESAQATYEYRVSLGLNPVHNVVNQEQKFYFKVEEYEDETPVHDLKARFIIYKDVRAYLQSSDELYDRSPNNRLANYEVFESEDGVYAATHVFTEPGIYLLVARIYDETKKNNNVIKEITKYIQIEPQGPSMVFWGFMGLSLAIGAFVASGSHKW